MSGVRLTEKDRSRIKAEISDGLEDLKDRWRLPLGVATAQDGSWNDVPGRNLSLLAGRFWDDLRVEDAPGRHSNQLLPKIASKEAVIYAGEASVYVEALREEFVELEDDVAAFMKQRWDELRGDEICQRAARDAETYEFGVVEIGWRYRDERGELIGARGEAEAGEEAEPLMTPMGELLEPVEEPVEFATSEEAEAAARAESLREDAEAWGHAMEDGPYIERVCPRDLVADPFATSWDLADARYAYRIRRLPLREVQANKSLAHTADLKGKPYGTQERKARRGLDSDERRDDAARDNYVTLYDGYTQVKDRWVRVVMSDENDEALLVEEYPYANDDGRSIWRRCRFPWRVFPGIVVDNDSRYPEAPVGQAADTQIAYDLAFARVTESASGNEEVYFYDADLMTEEQASDIEHARGRKLIGVPGNLLATGVLQRMPHVPEGPEVSAVLEYYSREIRQQLGVSEYEEAVMPEKQVTKAEAMILQSAGGARTQAQVAKYNEYRGWIMTDLLAVVQLFGERPLPYVKQLADGKNAWGVMTGLETRGADLDGNPLPAGIQFAVKIAVSSEAQKNKDLDLQRKMQALGVLAPLAEAGAANLRPIVREIVKALGIEDVDSVIPEPDAQLAVGGGQFAGSGGQPGGPEGQIPPELLAQLMEGGAGA